MKKTALRILALIFAITAVATVLTGCLGSMMGPTASIANEDKDPKPFEERQIKFVPASNAQVNINTPIGYFVYEDNELRILTPDSKTADGTPDGIKDLSLVVYDGDKNADGNNFANTEDYKYFIDEKTGYLYLNSKVLGDVEIEVESENGSELIGEDAAILKVMPRTASLLDIIIGLFGLYLLYSAIVGKGKLYNNDFIKEGMEQKHKTIVRITALVIGVLMLATVAIAFLDKYGAYRLATAIIFGVILVVFITATVLLRRCTDQEAKRKAMTDRYAGTAGKNPAAAFIFDENEPTVDDIKTEE